MSATSTTSKTRRLALALVALLFASLLAAPATPASADETGMVDVIVRTIDGLSIATTIELMGGTVTGSLNAIDSVTAEVPASSLASIESIPGVLSVTRDLSVQLSGAGWDQGNKDANTLKETGSVVNASSAYAAGFDGSGITVALIDSGVSPVPGLDGASKIINGPDLSLDSQVPALAHLDAYGHGTHMAGIIGANADGATGIAPGASILNVKVGAANGAVDVSQVLAGINWVIEHKNDNGMNVRVLNLSFGTDSPQSYMIDPLSYAVEVAWRNGIVVVVASGNDSNGSALRSPATNPLHHCRRRLRHSRICPTPRRQRTDMVKLWHQPHRRRCRSWRIDCLAPGARLLRRCQLPRRPGRRQTVQGFRKQPIGRSCVRCRRLGT